MTGADPASSGRESGILAEPPVASAGRAMPLRMVAVAVLALFGVAAFGLAPDTVLEVPPTVPVVRELPLPESAMRATAPEPAILWREERVRRGDTIGALLARAGVDDPAAFAWLRTDPAARPLYQLRPGRPLRVATTGDGALVELRVGTATEALAIARDGGGFVAAPAAGGVETRQVLRAGVIHGSLFGAADAIGLPDAVTMALADAFSGDIDFHLDLRRGDRFAVLYEMQFVDGEPVAAGRVLAAEFENRGRLLRAFRWTGDDGADGYYDEDGKNARKSFLRSPMAFSRVTSGFSLARFHPILANWRAHTGVDYGAPTGTPVRATGEGTVIHAGWKPGYGNVVVLKHNGAYSTWYGHLSRFAAGLRVGARVRQGDTIGHVGQTGWATGPHLHYEFRVSEVPRNPQTLALPAAEPLPAAQRSAFRAAIAPAVEQLAVARRAPTAVLASAE
ncbi:MAG: peptidoglycan DD-metalloendopeptidase family protein [Burkholderiales bacterium]